jgi:hypothetical protein
LSSPELTTRSFWISEMVVPLVSNPASFDVIVPSAVSDLFIVCRFPYCQWEHRWSSHGDWEGEHQLTRSFV